MADNGASQRRGQSSDNITPIGTTGFTGETSYFPPGFGEIGSHDGTQNPIVVRLLEASTVDTHDMAARSGRVNESFQTKIGTAIPESPNAGNYVGPQLSTPSTIGGGGGGGGPTTVTTYKLRARDSACLLTDPNKYVEWTTTVTPLSVASYPGSLPCGGPLVELTVLSIITI